MSYPEEEDQQGASTKSFLGHLEDLRLTIIRSFVALVAGMIVTIPLAPRILGLTKLPLVRAGKDPQTFLRVIEVSAGLSIAMRVVFWSGMILSAPFITYFAACFIFPGLTRRERSVVVRSLGWAVGLFAAGVLMAYFVTLPLALRVMFHITEVMNIGLEFVELSNYVSFVLRLLLVFGCAFELPVVVFVLGVLGIVTSAQLRAKRRHVIVGLMVVSMLLTPSDPYTMILMACPLIALYEICIWVIRAREKRVAREEGLPTSGA
jgi:sec-independent protein translocase protein TatC